MELRLRRTVSARYTTDDLSQRRSRVSDSPEQSTTRSRHRHRCRASPARRRRGSSPSRGIPVTLVEMRPSTPSPAHHTGDFAELVCSNSLKNEDPNTAAGLLKHELTTLGSLVLEVARAPARAGRVGARRRPGALLGRAHRVGSEHPLVTVVREEATEIPDGRVIVATGPLTSPALEPALQSLVGDARLAFYDAAAPIVDAESIDRSIVFAASRYDKGEGADYLNAPMDRDEYEAFRAELVAARRVDRQGVRAGRSVPGVPADRGGRAHGHRRASLRRAQAGRPRRPAHRRPAVGRRAAARGERRRWTAYNLVGFQTNLAFGEQERVFRMIPGLERAEFLRHGVMHRNTFVDAPRAARRRRSRCAPSHASASPAS